MSYWVAHVREVYDNYNDAAVDMIIAFGEALEITTEEAISQEFLEKGS